MANPSEGDGERAEPLLPIVQAPKLDGSGADEDASETMGETAAQATLSRSIRFAMLAAAVASAAALGSFVGSLSAAGVTRLWPGGPAAPASAAMAAANTPQANKAELAELAALKANVDGAARGANGQFAKLAERLDRVERVQIESATKLAHVADAMDRLEKKSVTAAATPPATVPETTGSVANNQPATAVAVAPVEAKPADKILDDWIVQDVRAGHALVENRYGGVFDVAAGGVLPGLGHVETIKPQDGQWIVVTARGLISSAP
ncbi:MAG: hypothetical protein P4L80_15015 [Xanthobacteraceae bacterium]|nr:hypothetical protein [Xanthobacteraceae bacterium]